MRKRIVLGIAIVGMAIFSFGCGKKTEVTPSEDNQISIESELKETPVISEQEEPEEAVISPEGPATNLEEPAVEEPESDFEKTEEPEIEEEHIENVEGDSECEAWGEPYNDFYFVKYEDDRHEDSAGNPILWFGDWDKLTAGCSVYCAVENEEINVTASSTLEDIGSNSYRAENVCVQNNAAAWVEGSEGSGIGEYLEIKRKLDVSDKNYGIDYTEICIVNGYIKNEKVWKNNNRVKTLAFYYNDEYLFDIDLEDTYSPQTISLEKYNLHADSGEDAVFKFVIKDVYKGDKYDDTAITGIIVDFYTPNH